MFKKAYTSIKIIFGFLALWTLLFTQSNNTLQHTSVLQKEANKKKEDISPVVQSDSKDDFLFVDCTGFFE